MAFKVPASFHPGHLLSNVDPALEQFWHPVALAADLPVDGAPLRIELLDKHWVVVRLGGRLAAMWDRCPHRAAVEPAEFPLDESPFLDPDHDGFVAGPFETPVGAGLLTDNFLDVTHLPFLHAQTFAGPTSEMHTLRVTRDGWSLRQSTDSVTAERGEPVPVHYDDELHAPFVCELRMTAPDGTGPADHVWSFCQPIAADRTRWYLVQAYSGLDHDPVAIAEATGFQTRVGLEDLSILEPMPVPHLPLDSSECHTRGDKGCVTYRQIMKDVVSGATRPASLPTLRSAS